MGRVNNFDAVRLLAAAVVIFGHAHPLTNTPSPALLGNSVQALAVKIFFVISGYLIFTSWTLEPSLPRYLRKRSLRIFPALIAICLVSALLLGPALTTLPLGDYFSSPGTYYYFKNALLSPVYDLPGLFQDNTYPVAVNGSLWSLPVEFAMYLALPAVCAIGYALRARWFLGAATFALCAASLYFVRLHTPEVHPVFYGSDLISALDVAPYFMLGAFVAHMKWERFLDPGLGPVRDRRGRAGAAEQRLGLRTRAVPRAAAGGAVAGPGRAPGAVARRPLRRFLLRPVPVRLRRPADRQSPRRQQAQRGRERPDQPAHRAGLRGAVVAFHRKADARAEEQKTRYATRT